MNMKRIISVVTVLAVLLTVFASFSAIAAETAEVDTTGAEQQLSNPATGDLLFGIFVFTALVAIIILYLVMRKKYIG